MKRLLLTVTGTIAGLVALLSFKTQSHPLADTAPLPSAALDEPASGATAGGTTASTSSTATASPSGPAVSAKTFLGSAITTRYGIVQVKVTVSGTKITNVGFAQLTAFDPHSEQINSYAGAQLLKETLAAQSADVDTVSGASYTSDGYRQSLQSALDEAGLR